jgi:hypothetical protein
VDFLTLYGHALDFELGSADRTELFTTERRKLAVNRAQREFARLTQCYIREFRVPLVNGTSTYDIEAATGSAFVNFSRRPVELIRTKGAVVTQTPLARHDVPWLDFHKAGWRDSEVKGTPEVVAYNPDAGAANIILVPTPAVPASETWAVLVAALATPSDLLADSDVPFQLALDAPTQLEPYHWAIAHFAASLLERLRKDTEAVEHQLALFGAYVSDYLGGRRPRGQHNRVSQQRNYLKPSHVSGALVQGDPRV